MKRNKLFVLAGALTLAVVSIFGTKPAKKFAMATQASAGSYGNIFSGATSSHLTTVKAGLNTALFATISGGILQTLRTAGAGSKTLYFKP